MATYCGVDFHARQQLVKWRHTEDGEIHERQLWHQSKDEVLAFYAQFSGRVIVCLETSGYSSWFETLLEQLGHEAWIGHATAIRRRARSRQKTDRRDAELIPDLLLQNEFPRIHRLSGESGSAAAVALPPSPGAVTHQELQLIAGDRAQCRSFVASQAQNP